MSKKEFSPAVLSVTSSYGLIQAIWLGLSIILGGVFSFIFGDLIDAVSMYSTYEGYVDNLRLLKWVALVQLCIAPFAMAAVWMFGLKVVILNSSTRLALLAVMVAGGVVGFGGISLGGSNGFGVFVRALLQACDWFAGNIIIFLGLKLFGVSILALVKSTIRRG